MEERSCKLKFDLKTFLKNAFTKGTIINNENIKAVVILGSFGHPVFAALHLYIFKMPWDNMILKTSAGLVCLSLATKELWPKKLKPLFPFYWHFMLIYNLPFLITLTALNNGFIKTWPIWEVIMLYILIIFIPHWFMLFIDLLIGVLLALFFHGLISNEMIFEPLITFFNLGTESILYLSTFIFVIASGTIFSRSNVEGISRIVSEERTKILKSLAGSIAHELRNPLNTINLIGSQIKDLVPEFDKTNVKNSGDAKSKLLSLTSHITDATSNANNIINIILGDLSEKKINPEDFAYLNPAKALPEILEKYGYRSDEERAKINLLLPESGKENEQNNFVFKAVPDRFTYIIFNLLKNALYYLDQYPESTITIGTEVKEIDGKQYNVIYVHDTGPGIATNTIPKLFGDFYTSGKKEGTGLGLAFCKRNMKLFGGDIICESELGDDNNGNDSNNGNKKNGWTKFSLLFPILSESEIELAKTESRKRKVLLVDDQEVNLITLKSKIERILPDISCDIAKGGKEAINMAKENKYHLILMDVQMPETNGVEAARKIRLHDKEVPIIALTSLSKESLLEEINFVISKESFNYYLNKLSTDNILCRAVSKWIMDLEDNLHYIGSKEEYLKVLKDKKLLLADDERINLIMTKKILEAASFL
ncbi:MAG: integral rane sensor hybrid histidine kinase [Rickettsiaceae bacterium]|nr:integral rane sensor hybrid histidine kinase [Rickettsiaceae bacterium]